LARKLTDPQLRSYVAMIMQQPHVQTNMGHVAICTCDSRIAKKSIEPILAWIQDPQVQVIVLERDAPLETIARLVEEGRKRNLKMNTVSEGASKVLLEDNVTRGFLAVALATHAMVSVGGTVELYGFGGAGHHNDPNLHIGHNVDQEWRVWRKLGSQAPWFTWHGNAIEQEYSFPKVVLREQGKKKEYSFQVPADDISLNSSIRTANSPGLMFTASQSLQTNVLMWLTGDSTWGAIPQYDDNDAQRSSKTFDSERGKVMVSNLSVKGQALRQNRRHQEKRLASVVDACGMPCSTPFVPLQVPFQGGYHGQETGCSNDERFLESHDVLFTRTLVELVNKDHWTDKYLFTLEATMRVLEHAMVRVDHVLKQLKDSISVQTPVIVCVLSDGWNRAFHGSADQSRYWRCRLEFSKCATLGQFKGWCNDYASSKPRNSPTLP